jgi:hypothetical protein
MINPITIKQKSPPIRSLRFEILIMLILRQPAPH